MYIKKIILAFHLKLVHFVCAGSGQCMPWESLVKGFSFYHVGPRDQTWNIRLVQKWLYPSTILWGSAYKFLISTFYAPRNISESFLYLLGQQTQETFCFREFYYKEKIQWLASFPSFFTSFLCPLSFVYSANVLVTSFCSYPFPIFFPSNHNALV